MKTEQKITKTQMVNDFLLNREIDHNRKELKKIRHYMTFWLSARGGSLELAVAYGRAVKELRDKKQV